MNVYVDNGALVIAGDDLTMRIEAADLKMSNYEQYEYDQYDRTPIRMMPTHAFLAGKFEGKAPNLIIPNINYEVGKEYTVEQLINQSPPQDTVIINELSHVLQYQGNDWRMGTIPVDVQLTYPNKLTKFKVIHIP